MFILCKMITCTKYQLQPKTFLPAHFLTTTAAPLGVMTRTGWPSSGTCSMLVYSWLKKITILWRKSEIPIIEWSKFSFFFLTNLSSLYLKRERLYQNLNTKSKALNISLRERIFNHLNIVDWCVLDDIWIVLSWGWLKHSYNLVAAAWVLGNEYINFGMVRCEIHWKALTEDT